MNLLKFIAASALCCSLASSTPTATSAQTLSNITDRTLPNGVRVLVDQEPDSQLVAIDVFVQTGGKPEEVARPGIAALVARTLLLGTSNQTEETISRQMAALGGGVNATWDRDLTQIKSLTLADKFDDAAYLLCDVIKNASFEDNAVSEAKTAIKQDLQDNADDIFQATYNQMRSSLFAGQDLSPSYISNRSVIYSLRPGDLRSFFEKYYTSDNIVISIAGNVNPEQAIHTIGLDLIDFDRHSLRHSALPSQDVPPLIKPVVVKSFRGDLNAGYILVGFRVPGAGAKDYPAILIANALLGGMKTSLLFTNLREKQALGYETASLYGEQIGMTDLTGYIISAGNQDPTGKSTVQTTASGSSPKDTSPFASVRSALMDQFHLLSSQPPTDTMLTRAKRFVAGSYLIKHERLEDRAYYLGFSEIALKTLGGYRFDTHFADAVNAVTASDVQRVATKYLSNGYVVSMTLPGDPKAGEVSR